MNVSANKSGLLLHIRFAYQRVVARLDGPFADKIIKPTEKIRNYANELQNLYGIKPKDSLHVACAIKAKCKYFLTTDKILIKKAMKLKKIKAINPLEFITLLE
ncbi:MAG: PIN domain-containing protein, partial [Thermodesulfobacteriota bacterium]